MPLSPPRPKSAAVISQKASKNPSDFLSSTLSFRLTHERAEAHAEARAGEEHILQTREERREDNLM